MTTTPFSSDSDLNLAGDREQLADIRERTEKLFRSGATGHQTAAFTCDLIDNFLLEIIRRSLFESQTFSVSGQRVVSDRAIIAIGGFGRGELAPYSDIDLLFLTRTPSDDEFEEIVSKIVRDCWDAGIKLGHGLRSLSETILLAKAEPHVATSLTEMRLLWGSASLYRELGSQFRKKVISSRRAAFIDDCVTARNDEQQEFGATVNALEPDVKRSKGGLRDLQLIRWIGAAAFGVSDFESLRLKGDLNKEEAWALRDAHDFLMRVRVDLHLNAGRPNDLLSREEQLRIADDRGLKDTRGQRAVEQFMQTYFRHTTAVSEIGERFLHRCRSTSLVRRMASFVMSYRLDGKYLVGQDRIRILPSAIRETVRSIHNLVKFYETASLLNVLPHSDTEDEIYSQLHYVNRSVDQATVSRFCQILSRPGFLGPLLRSMFKCGILEILIPHFSHARCLLQFNQYHSYTVDEHTLRTIEALEQYQSEDSPLGRIYQQIQRKEVLHLALLLHDLGKGMPGDHSEVGARIAQEIATRFFLSETQREELVFLVRYHLRMSHLAFRRDIADPKILMEFAQEVGSPDLLRKLFMMTAADIQGVGPKAWTSWKEELLLELFNRTLLCIGGSTTQFDDEASAEAMWKELTRTGIWGDLDEQPLQARRKLLNRMPSHYLLSTPTDKVASDLEIIERLDTETIHVDGRREPDAGVIEFRVISFGGSATGIFQRIVGVITARQFEVVAAEIATLPDGTFVDRFQVLEASFDEFDLESQIESICSTIRAVVNAPMSVEKLFKRHQRFSANSDSKPLSDLPTRVSIDNDSSEDRTIIDVFSHDQTGLLFTIARCLEEMELSVVLAKISTHFDQVVDVFYVTNADGNKITDPLWLKAIREKLERRIIEFQQHGHTLFTA